MVDPIPLDPLDPLDREGDPDGVSDFSESLENFLAAGGGALASVAIVGAVVTLGGLLVVPNLLSARGATKEFGLERATRERCLELGVTPEELAKLEAQGLAEGREGGVAAVSSSRGEDGPHAGGFGVEAAKPPE